jgi:hypothetical protein
LVPLAAGGGKVDWTPVIDGLNAGTNPDHPEFWGWPADYDQRLVEMAAIGVALAMAPEQVWDRLPPAARDATATWLGRINDVDVVDNNWLFFRVLVNLGLARVQSDQYDPAAETAALDRLESFYLSDGWYQDGPTQRCDYYLPWAMHFYGLIYATLAGDRDPERAQRFKDRAAEFAVQYARWFAADGAGVPYGRSLTYRFAQAGFWGALALADVEARPWGELRELMLSNLRWWARRPLTDNGGVLTVGYGYPNLTMAEQYNSPGSPYWAMKGFFALAVPRTHPFWSADAVEASAGDDVSEQPHAGMVLCRDTTGEHVFALAGGQPGAKFHHGPEKYAKFAYSTAFGFSVPAGDFSLGQRAADSMLSLSDDESYWRVRTDVAESRVDNGVVWSRWLPWPDVEIETWLVPILPWQVRVHRISTARELWSCEGGWAIDRGDVERAGQADHHQVDTGWAAAIYPGMAGGLRDLGADRDGLVITADPNTNLLFPRSAIPLLRGRHSPGEHTLVCAVFATTRPSAWERTWQQPPTLDEVAQRVPSAWSSDVP